MTTGRRWKQIVGAAVVCGLLGLAFAAWRILETTTISSLIPRPVTDVSAYPTVLARWSTSGLTGHFPVCVPPDAAEVRLSAQPRFLQGGAHLQLCLRLTPAEVAAAEATFAVAATHTFNGGGDTNDHANRPGGVPTTFFYTSGSVASAFDRSFTVYVLAAKPAPLAGPGDFPWNHGESCGAAVSRERGQVVYWAESW